MENRTQLVGDLMPGLLRMTMMIVLDTMVTTASTGMMTPSSGNTNIIGPCEVVVSNV